jgi:hypothetical protein
MRSYCLWPKDEANDESYWVAASSGDEARRLLANSVDEARDAEDKEKYECELDNTKSPPEGFIHRRLNGPIAIKRG